MASFAGSDKIHKFSYLVEAKKDVYVNTDNSRGTLNLFYSGDYNKAVPSFIIKKGERFVSSDDEAEGSCTISYKGVLYEGDCHWTVGFTDHETDFFNVKKQK
jgi:hypothetical protein